MSNIVDERQVVIQSMEGIVKVCANHGVCDEKCPLFDGGYGGCFFDHDYSPMNWTDSIVKLESGGVLYDE